jgi:hypothetical protein
VRQGRKLGYGLTAGAILIAVAVAILIAWAVNKWWYFLPVFMIEAGILGIVTGLLAGRQGTTSSRSYATYSETWGVIIALLGALLIVDDYSPGNLPLLVAIFLIVLGVLAIAIGRRK